MPRAGSVSVGAPELLRRYLLQPIGVRYCDSHSRFRRRSRVPFWSERSTYRVPDLPRAASSTDALRSPPARARTTSPASRHHTHRHTHRRDHRSTAAECVGALNTGAAAAARESREDSLALRPRAPPPAPRAAGRDEPKHSNTEHTHFDL